MIDFGRDIAIYRRTIDRMTIGVPSKSLLIVEFHGFEDSPLLARLADLAAMMADLGFPGAVIRATEPEFQAEIARCRWSALMDDVDERRRQADPFVEDAAVALEDLADIPNVQRGDRASRNPRHMVRPRFRRLPSRSASPQYARPPPTLSACARSPRNASRSFVSTRARTAASTATASREASSTNRCSALRIVRAFEAVKDAFDPLGSQPERIDARAPRFDNRELFRYPPS